MQGSLKQTFAIKWQEYHSTVYPDLWFSLCPFPYMLFYMLKVKMLHVKNISREGN